MLAFKSPSQREVNSHNWGVFEGSGRTKVQLGGKLTERSWKGQADAEEEYESS